MKGFITLTHGAWLYLITALIVILVGMFIVTKGQFLIIFQQDKLKDFFEPGVISIGTSGSTHLSKNNLEIHCRPGNVYDITLKDVKFHYKTTSDKNIQFYIVLDLGRRLSPATDDYNVIRTFGCAEENCGDTADISFDVRADHPSEQEFLHFTLWKAEPGVKNILELPDGSEDKTLSNLLGSQFRYYIGSVDVGNTVAEACLSVKCKDLDGRACEDTPGCWFDGWSIFGSCQGCKYISSCPEYTNRMECSLCSAYTRAYTQISCSWREDTNSCKEA